MQVHKRTFEGKVSVAERVDVTRLEDNNVLANLLSRVSSRRDQVLDQNREHELVLPRKDRD